MNIKLKNIIFILLFITACMTIQAQVKIIAHRGASYLAPENTVAATKLAWEKGSDAAECDIWLSKDNKIIACHDASTKRTTGQNHQISKTESGILRELDAGSYKDERYRGEKLPFLYELLQTVPRGKELVVEIKCENEVLPYLKTEVEKYKEQTNITFICFDFNTICETKELFPDHPCYWLCSNALMLKSNLNKVAEAKLNGVSLHYSLIDKDLMELAEDLGLEVYSWTVDSPEEAKRLIALEVKGITTNRPGWLRKQIQ